VNVWSKQYFRLRKENDKASFLDYYPSEKVLKPVGSVPLAGAFVRMVPTFESMKLYKRRHIVEIQEPSRKWKLDFCDSFSLKYEWFHLLYAQALTFPGKSITVDCTLARNSPKDHIFTNIFDAVGLFYVNSS
jgi:hypothetical protein